jgi:hypothetical protein
MGAENIPKLEIMDTGTEEKGGSVDYPRASTDWLNLNSTTIRPEVDYLTNNYLAQKKNFILKIWDFISNRIQSKNPPRYTVTGVFHVDNISNVQTLLNMGDTFGLKKIRGGYGTLGVMPGNISGEVYVIIRSFRISETVQESTTTIRVTMSLEQV